MMLKCLDAASGRQIWACDLIKEHAGRNIHWESGSSPVVEGDLVFVAGGGPGQALLAFDKNDGHVFWKGQDDYMTQSTPLVAHPPWPKAGHLLYAKGIGLGCPDDRRGPVAICVSVPGGDRHHASGVRRYCVLLGRLRRGVQRVQDQQNGQRLPSQPALVPAGQRVAESVEHAGVQPGVPLRDPRTGEIRRGAAGLRGTGDPERSGGRTRALGRVAARWWTGTCWCSVTPEIWSW